MLRAVCARRGLCLVLVSIAGCAKESTLMPTPALYAGAADRLADRTIERRQSTDIEVLYATDRQYDPSLAPDPYPPLRERFLRLGVAHVSVGGPNASWSDLLAASTSVDRKDDLRIRLMSVEDFGPLAQSTVPFDDISEDPNVGEAGRRFAELIDQRLAESTKKDIYLFISPFKVRFEQIVGIAAEFRHYLGRDGVFIAYSWPSKEGNLSYLNAAENAYRTRRCLRVLFEYLAASTDAERVHLITYSAGARVLSGALHQLSLTSRHMSDTELEEYLPLGQVIFCAPDIDSGAFLEHMIDGLKRAPGALTVYTSTEDKALRMSRMLYGNNRLGMIQLENFQNPSRLMDLDRVSVVSVTNAEDGTIGNGHGYFRLSPWVSTDILLMLGEGLPPAERGLIRSPEDPIWRFPADYLQRVPMQPSPAP